MSNFIVYSLYGNRLKYVLGALVAARRNTFIYPEWQQVFYIDSSVPRWLVKRLSLKGYSLIEGSPSIHNKMMWRFQTHLLPDADYVLFRDVDSWPLRREAELVARWIESGKDFHVIRDHPFHTYGIMGGLWGCRYREGIFPQDAIELNKFGSAYGADIEFLETNVYPLLRGRSLIHDGFFFVEEESQKIPRRALSFHGMTWWPSASLMLSMLKNLDVYLFPSGDLRLKCTEIIRSRLYAR